MRLLLFALLSFIGTPIFSEETSCKPQNRGCLLDMALKIASSTSRSSTRNEIYFTAAKTLLKAGDFKNANLISKHINDEIVLSELKAEFAIVEASMGNFVSAFEIAISINDSRNQSQRINALEEIAIIQAIEMGIEPAFKTVSAIVNPYRRSQAQAAISIGLASAGMLSMALNAATQVGTGYWFSETKENFNIASGVVARPKDFDQFWFYEALIEIASIQGKSGDLNGALNTVLSIPDLEARSKGFSKISELLAAKGDFELALDLTKRIETPYGDKLAFNLIIKQLVMQGNYSQSLTLANKLKQHYGDENGLVFLAKSIINANKVSSARKILHDISSVENRNEILKQLFMHFVSDDNIPEALTIINDSKDRKFVFECIKEMASELARSNKNEKALNLAKQFLNTQEMDEIYFITSIERARQNDIKTSFEFIMKIKNEVDRAIAMATILEFID